LVYAWPAAVFAVTAKSYALLTELAEAATDTDVFVTESTTCKRPCTELLPVVIVAGNVVPAPVVITRVELEDVYVNPVTPATAFVVAAVIRPLESTVITGIDELLPYEPGVTAVFARVTLIEPLARLVNVLLPVASPVMSIFKLGFDWMYDQSKLPVIAFAVTLAN